MTDAHLRLQEELEAQGSGCVVLSQEEALEILGELRRLWVMEEAINVAAKTWASMYFRNPRAFLSLDAAAQILYKILGVK
jgi:hypothetical protein